MKENHVIRTHRRRLLLYGLLLLAVMSFIFLMSCRSGPDSQLLSDQFSDSFLGKILSRILPLLTEDFRGSIRKYAHVFEFFCLGVCSLLFFHELFWVSRHRLLKAISSASIWSFVYACSDEWHQTFVPERAGMISDLRFDAAGFLCGIALLGSIMGIWKKRRSGMPH